MKLKINIEGNLEIERNGKFKEVMCPETGFEIPCGDHCALFKSYKDYYDGEDGIVIALCRQTFGEKIENFIDERPRKKD